MVHLFAPISCGLYIHAPPSTHAFYLGAAEKEGWEEFERFEDSAPERQELSTFRDVLEENGGELSFETEQKLMAIMYEARTNQDFSELFVIDPEDETMRSYLRSQRALQQTIRARIGNLLTNEQLEVFEQNQNSHLEMLESSADLSDRLFKAEDDGSGDQ